MMWEMATKGLGPMGVGCGNPTIIQKRKFMNTILKVVVGSQAHGLATPESDFDYRGVYVLPTEDILSLGFKYSGSNWVEGEKEDCTAWEIGHFLTLALQNNPTILEVFNSPVVDNLHILGSQLRDLFPYIINPKRAYDAFTGYGKNQQKKFLDKKDSRPHKYAAAHIRVLCNLNELLETGNFNVNMTNHPLFETIKRIKNKNYSVGEVIDLTEYLTDKATHLLATCTIPSKTDEERYKVLNDFLLKVRSEFWRKA